MNVFAGAAWVSSEAVPLAGGAVGWELTPWVGVEGSGSWLSQRRSANAFAADLKALVNLAAGHPVVPFLEGGIGLYRASFDPSRGTLPDFYQGRMAANAITVTVMKILLAIDGSEYSRAATQAVIAQFPRERAEVRVLHADEWPNRLPTSLAFAEGPTAASDILELREQRRRQGEELVSRAAQQLQAAGFQTSTTVREGDARHAILDVAAEWGPDVIVLGSHGRKGMDRFLLGSVSESVVRHAPCSVEIVRAK